MALIRATSGSSGGGAEWKTDVTVSGYYFEANWNYDADTVIMIYEQNGVRTITMYDMNADLWFAQSATSQIWRCYGVDSRVTITPRSISGTFTNLTLTNMSIIPVKGKPTGYYT